MLEWKHNGQSSTGSNLYCAGAAVLRYSNLEFVATMPSAAREFVIRKEPPTTKPGHNVFVADLESLGRAELAALILEQQKLILQQQRLIEQLRKEVEELRRVADARRRRSPKEKRRRIRNGPGGSRARGYSGGARRQFSLRRKW